MCRYEDNLSLLCRCVESLLRRGANPNRIVGDGVSAVHLAAGKESEKGLRCLKLILQHGADPNLRTTENLTPLHIAASWGCFQNLRFLLRNGGNPNLTDQSPTSGSVPSAENSASPPLAKPCAHKSDLTVEQCGFSVRNQSLTFVDDGNRQLKEGVRKHIEQSSLSATGRDAGKVAVTSTETHCIPSPFVTGRTRSRLSRHSEKMSQKLASFQASSCLFEQTLPTAIRLRRNTVKSPYGWSKHSFNKDKMEDVDSQLSSLKLSVSSDGQSQADTLILSDSMADTVLISERIVESQLETSVSEAGNKVTTPECLTGMQEVKKTAKGMPQIIPTAVGDKESSVTCGLASQGSLPFQVDNSESASSLMYESPKAQKNPGANPGCSGCTPRYSMSRLSGRSRQALANLSCTPAGQPLTTDTDVPVEYLYTDTEEGHKLIETHVPPTANTSFIAGYSPELENGLHRFVLPNCQADELALCEQFDKPDQNKRWREGFIKSSFNYLLLDPRVTKNLPYRSQSMNPKECFQTFISAVFYVGKGKRSRPYSHLYEALEYFKGDKTSKKLCSKVQHILQVWNAGHGVISLHCFQNVIAVEAYTREACMVDAIGLKMLTNQKRGDYYGVVSTWPVRRKRELGVHLLYRAMQIF
ncbi:uncharacterized protein, partial [Sinocyclocheilus grahami]|uniref:uncharacterized protein n=1 Tax=Sinocyclocheilus grahami TaxID=75366 RepID=UPI0007AD4BC5